ncbi:hypothetical protein [Streptomyces sp. NPDC015414]|uniref:hypothetical protein n=1 Tax=Streptomyces sp. NPDC015414 TaxID=3364957 RepID=UPI0036FEB56D
MNATVSPVPAPALGVLEDCEWSAAPVSGLGRICSGCRPPARRRGPDPPRWLDGIARPDTAQLASAQARFGYEQHTAALIRAAARADATSVLGAV